MPKFVNTDEKCAEFIEASWKVIARDGLQGTTLRRVANEAKCTTGSLTHYFSDRQSLLIETLRVAHFRAGERMARAAEAAETDYQRLEAVMFESLPLDAVRLSEWKVWLAFWGGSMSDPDLAAENTRRYEEWRALVGTLLAPLTENSGRDSEILIALIDGLGLRLARDTSEGRILKRMQAACAALLAEYLTRFKP